MADGERKEPDRQRLFCALRLPEAVLDALVGWQAEHVPAGRRTPRENLHVTLAFLGSRPASDVDGIAHALADAAAAAGSITLRSRLYRETRGAGMVVLGDDGAAGAALAADLGRRLELLGVYRPERRPWLPHVTVVRFRERLRLAPPAPELGPFSPSDAAVYVSRLRPGGARYEALETAALGGR